MDTSEQTNRLEQEDVVTKTTTGGYSPYPDDAWEEIEFTRNYAERATDEVHDRYWNGSHGDTRSLQTTILHIEDGVTTGHLRHEHWDYDSTNGPSYTLVEDIDLFADPANTPQDPPPTSNHVHDAEDAGGFWAGFAAGLGYGVIEVGNAGLKAVTFGYANNDATADYYANAAGLSDTDRRLTRFAANVGVNAAVGAVTPSLLGAAGKTAVGSVAGRALATPVGRIAATGAGAYFTGQNGINAVRNGVAAAQAIADGRGLDALEAATLTIENGFGAYGGARALFAKPRVGSVPDTAPHCFVADTTVKEPVAKSMLAHVGTYVAIVMLSISAAEYARLRRRARRLQQAAEAEASDSTLPEDAVFSEVDEAFADFAESQHFSADDDFDFEIDSTQEANDHDARQLARV